MSKKSRDGAKAMRALSYLSTTDWHNRVIHKDLYEEVAQELERLSELEDVFKSVRVLLLVMEGLMFNALIGTDKPDMWDATWEQILKEAGL